MTSPVFSHRRTSPASLTVVPDTGSSTIMYIATRLPNGLAFCAAKYTAPSSSCSSSGVLILTVPIFEPSGQKLTPGCSEPIASGENVAHCTPCSDSGLNSVKSVKPAKPSEQACRPSAPAGLIVTPAGNATVVSLREDSPSPSGLSPAVCGTGTPTVRPEELLASLTSGATAIAAGNASFEQPVICTGSPSP